MDRYELVLPILGSVALVAGWVPAFTKDRPISLPIILLIAMPISIALVTILGVWVGDLGIAAALLLGSVLAPTGPLRPLADNPQGFFAVAATLLAYGAAELAQGYGFLAVFVAAVTLRSSERTHEFHRELHGFVEETEQLLVVAVCYCCSAPRSAPVCSPSYRPEPLS